MQKLFEIKAKYFFIFIFILTVIPVRQVFSQESDVTIKKNIRGTVITCLIGETKSYCLHPKNGEPDIFIGTLSGLYEYPSLKFQLDNVIDTGEIVFCSGVVLDGKDGKFFDIKKDIQIKKTGLKLRK